MYWLCTSLRVYVLYTVYTWAGFTLSLCVPLVWLQDEWDDDETKGKLTYYFNGLPRQIEVEPDMIHNPQYSKLRLAIEWVPASSASFEHCCGRCLWCTYARTHVDIGTAGMVLVHTCVCMCIFEHSTCSIYFVCVYVCMLYSSYELLRVTTKAAWDFATCGHLSAHPPHVNPYTY